MPAREPNKPVVLVVDDEIQMAEMLADGLADRGYQAVAVASSEAAMARFGRACSAAMKNTPSATTANTSDSANASHGWMPSVP